MPQRDCQGPAQEPGPKEKPGAGGIVSPDMRPPVILVVDDEATVRGLLGMVLEQSGFAVRLAASGPEALAAYRQHRDAIGLVLLDVRMPGLDGPQTLAALREIDPGIRCCFLTGAAGLYTAEDLRRLGAVGLFPKPFDLAELTRALRRLTSG